MVSFTADVGVLGLGTSGSMALWRLAKRGIRAHGFERYGVAHDRSAAGGETRLFRSANLVDRRYVPLAADALRLWRELEAESGRELLTLNGHLILGPPDAPSLVNALTFARDFGLKHQVLDAAALRKLHPQHQVDDETIGLLDEVGGYIRPELSVLAATERARDLGAIVHTHTRAQLVDADGDGATVATDAGEYRFRQLVIAAGPWFGQVLPEFRDHIQVRRVLQAWFAPRDPSAYAPDALPVFLRTGLPGSLTYFYGTPLIDGAGVKLGVAGTNREIASPDDLDRTVPLEDLANFAEVVDRYLPGLHPDPIRVGAYMEGYTTDSTPIVGPVTRYPAIIALGGFSGAGFKFAPAMGDLAADYVESGDTTREADMFSPSRPLASWPADG